MKHKYAITSNNIRQTAIFYFFFKRKLINPNQTESETYTNSFTIDGDTWDY